jgi:hypothetical protein
MELVEEKIQIIAKEIQEANATPWTVTKIIKALSEMKTGNEKKLKEKASELLLELDPNAAVIYERFNSMRVYTSKELAENFNRGHIITSLLKETSISRSVAEKITQEVEEQIKDAKINFLTTGLIRELVNTKLIGYGFEEFRHKYTRLGEPAHEIKKKLAKHPYSGEQVREYNSLLVIPKSAREMHYDGSIFIEDIEGFSHRPFSYTFIAKKDDTLEKTISKNIKNLVDKRKYVYLPPNIYGLTYVCAPFIKNNAQTQKTSSLLKELLKIPKEGFTTSLELFTPAKLEEYSEYRLKAAELSNNLLDQKNVVLGVDSKYSLKLINTKNRNFNILNNSHQEYYPLNNKFFSPTQGIDLFVNINLCRLGETVDDFFLELGNVSKQIEKLKDTKQRLLLKKKYTKEFKIEEMKTGIGLTNLFNLAENFKDEKPVEFAKKTYRELTKLFPKDLFFGLSQQIVLDKFSTVNRKEVFSQDALGFEDCLTSKKCCFSGKACTIKEVNELLDKKVKQIEFVSMN